MPELAEVEVVRRNLEAWWTRPARDVRLVDEKLVTRGAPEDLERLLRSAPPKLLRRGKYLVARFGDEAVVFHFRMTGKIVKASEPRPRFARLSWDGTDGGWLVFKDARRLGHVDVLEPGGLASYAPLVAMGPEPHELDAVTLRQRLPARRGLKAALLDQAVVAGVGNIAISEVFWRLHLSPTIKCAALTDDQLTALAATLPTYFDELIDAQMADEITYINEGGDGPNPFDVYGREDEPCPRCKTPIQRLTVAARSSYFCPTCQP